MPSELNKSFTLALEQNHDYVKKSLAQVDVEKAEASVPADAKDVKQIIKSTVGFNHVNRIIMQRMIQWMASVSQQHASQPNANSMRLNSMHPSLGSQVKLVSNVNLTLGQI